MRIHSRLQNCCAEKIELSPSASYLRHLSFSELVHIDTDEQLIRLTLNLHSLYQKVWLYTNLFSTVPRYYETQLLLREMINA